MRTRQLAGVLGGAALLLLSRAAGADVAYQSQQRSITVSNTAGVGGLQTAAAPDFAPFVRNITLSTIFPGSTGPIPNVASGRIDCQVDPNSLRAIGLLAGAGGYDEDTGTTEVGDSRLVVLVAFNVTTPTPYTLTAAPRPDLHATDEFVLEFRDQTRNNRIIGLSQTDAPQQVNLSGTLLPGDYLMRYRVQATFDAAQATRDFAFNLALGCRADFNGVGGVSVQDIFDYLAAWFAGDQRADLDGVGGITAQDLFDFLGAWFAGCG